jgi:hypothetical protein
MRFLIVFSCELCGEEFKTSVNKARDKSVHLVEMLLNFFYFVTDTKLNCYPVPGCEKGK